MVEDTAGSVESMTAAPGREHTDPSLPSPQLPHHGEVPVSFPGTALRWSRRADVTEFEVVADDFETAPAERVEAILAQLDSIGKMPEVHGSRIQIAAETPAGRNHVLASKVAEALGLDATRELHELRMDLPVPADHPIRQVSPSIRTRSFCPGVDDAAWLRVNNRAFAAHPDQGSETEETLHTRTSEPWFDPPGFRLLDDTDRDGELAGFCWTKVHTPTRRDPAVGEIYVIGVDPSHHGHGLGAALLLDGLDHLAGRGLTVAGLYVESDNAPALRLYDRLGFVLHRRRLVYEP